MRGVAASAFARSFYLVSGAPGAEAEAKGNRLLTPSPSRVETQLLLLVIVTGTASSSFYFAATSTTAANGTIATVMAKIMATF